MAIAPVKLTKQWSIAGGRLGKPFGLTDVKDIDTPQGTVSFVKIDKNADWLLKAILGTANKGALRRSTLFSSLGEKLTHGVADPASRWTPNGVPESPSSSAVADAPSPAVAESEPCDPMSQLEEISSENVTPKKRKTQGAYKSIRGQTMPEYEPLSHPGRTEDRKIRLLPTSTVSLWLCIEDIPWLVRWLSDELRSGGVPLPKSDPLDALECNCDADNVHIRWDFNGAWEAIILQDSLGRAKRGMKYKCVVSDFDQDKWLAVGANARYGTDFERARPEQKKEASKLFLEKHMKGVMGRQDPVA
mgnify:FL=1